MLKRRGGEGGWKEGLHMEECKGGNVGNEWKEKGKGVENRKCCGKGRKERR